MILVFVILAVCFIGAVTLLTFLFLVGRGAFKAARPAGRAYLRGVDRMYRGMGITPPSERRRKR